MGQDVDLLSVGTHCSVKHCRQLDFLPFTCDRCQLTTCAEHMNNHNCSAAKVSDNRVLPHCTVCSKLLMLPAGTNAQAIVKAHVASGCVKYVAPTAAEAARKNRCMHKGCKKKAMIATDCKSCHGKFCTGHRFPEDHACATRRREATSCAAEARQGSSLRSWLGALQS